MAGKIAKAAETAPVVASSNRTIMDYINLKKDDIAKALPSVLDADRFNMTVVTALNTNPKLRECTPISFVGAMMTAAQAGLEVNTPAGQAYLIPRWNSKKGVTECQFQLGYRGMIAQAFRGDVIQLDAQVVYENDDFEYEYGLDAVLRHKPARSNRGEPVYVYATFHTKSGGRGFEVMSMDDIDKHANAYSDSEKRGVFGPWKSHKLEMAKKTVLKHLLKYAPLQADVAKVVAADEGVKNAIKPDMFNEPSEYIDITDFNEGMGAEQVVEGGVFDAEPNH